MGDSISRSYVLTQLKHWQIANASYEDKAAYELIGVFMKMIEQAPEASDVEAVVKELEKEIDLAKEKERQCFLERNTNLGFCLNGKASGLGLAIKIVRGERDD